MNLSPGFETRVLKHLFRMVPSSATTLLGRMPAHYLAGLPFNLTPGTHLLLGGQKEVEEEGAQACPESQAYSLVAIALFTMPITLLYTYFNHLPINQITSNQQSNHESSIINHQSNHKPVNNPNQSLVQTVFPSTYQPLGQAGSELVYPPITNSFLHLFFVFKFPILLIFFLWFSLCICKNALIELKPKLAGLPRYFFIVHCYILFKFVCFPNFPMVKI